MLCKCCGDRFVKTSNNQKYCDKCKREIKESEVKKCDYCGKKLLIQHLTNRNIVPMSVRKR